MGSDWTSWLIVIAVVALAVGPVMMFQPGARQKRLARFRATANQRGVRVSLASKAITELQGTACYSLPWIDKTLQKNDWQLIRKSYNHELHVNDVWAWASSAPRVEVLNVLQQQTLELPESVQSILASPAGLGVYWSELGTDAELEFLLQWLLLTQQQLVSNK